MSHVSPMIHKRTPSPTPTRRIPLPPGHFLSLQPSYAQSTELFPSGTPSTSAHDSNGLAPNVASLASADFDVDVRSGFLPSTQNLDRLPAAWEVWEEAFDAARGRGVGDGLRIGGGREKDKLWRRGIEMMPVLETRPLEASILLLRRAHLVLTFTLHFYVHTSPPTGSLSIPRSIAAPLVPISNLLGLPPVVTYADTVLYNFTSTIPSEAPHYTSNPPLRALGSFTNTRSEEQFYVISAMCEIAGAQALKLMRQSLDELFLADELAIRRLTQYLRKLAVQIDRISEVTLSMLKHVDPEEFYHLIRPWFRGSDDGPNSRPWDLKATGSSADVEDAKLYAGPSAGQSSLIHAIDIFLTVDHTERTVLTEDTEEERTVVLDSEPTDSDTDVHIMVDHTPVSTTEPTKAAPTEATFVQRMLEYMPLPHRTFLLHLSTHPTPLRSLVVEHAHAQPSLVEAYDGALEALRRFREKHMRIVSVFIVQQARKKPSKRIRQLLGQEGDSDEVDDLSVDVGDLRGTGGSPLFRFLKRCRDNTTKAMIGQPKGPGYDLK